MRKKIIKKNRSYNKKIDQMFHELYELTDEEIAIVENNFDEKAK